MEIDEISNRSYSSPIIHEFCEKWEPGQELVEQLSNDITKALEGLKSEFPRLHKWSNIKLIKFLSRNWKNADSIQKDRNKIIQWHQKKSDL